MNAHMMKFIHDLLMLSFCLIQFSQAATIQTSTPIEHVIVIVGENRTFDNLFATYLPKQGQMISNLFSKGIVKADGSPGSQFNLAQQKIANNPGIYSPIPSTTGSYTALPQPYATGAFGQRQDIPDARFPTDLPNGPFPITGYVSYGAHTGDPTHRFYQMWQQVNGGKNDLFTWVGQVTGPGPSNVNTKLAPSSTFQGGVAMGFYNMQAGDAPYFKYLADTYAIADNYHQPIMGGTTANYFALATADVAVYTENGKPSVPPAKLIANPNAQAGTNNWYTEDGYRGGTFTRCADITEAGVAGIQALLKSLPYRPFNDGNCAADTYYMLNNMEPGYSPTGELLEQKPNTMILPPQTMPHIGDGLSAAGISWKWYSGGRNDGKAVDKEYCAMCDTPSFFASTMTGRDLHKLQDMQQFYVDVKESKNFPAVSIIAPYDSISGHPGYAMQPSFDGLVTDIIARVQSNTALWNKTAILVTFDEGGGYYDSGYIQFIDFFGDGTRIPMLAVSPFAKAGYVDHTYYDHASILKFIEHNWHLSPLTKRSRDNLPNPIHELNNPYVPLNRPAIGDLMNLFDFKKTVQGKN